jgi:hypothetical protein
MFNKKVRIKKYMGLMFFKCIENLVCCLYIQMFKICQKKAIQAHSLINNIEIYI